jgi:hypothetical protein
MRQPSRQVAPPQFFQHFIFRRGAHCLVHFSTW